MTEQEGRKKVLEQVTDSEAEGRVLLELSENKLGLVLGEGG